MKKPKFGIWKNEMIDNIEYIVHSRDPIFFAKISQETGHHFILEYDREISEGLMKRTAEWYFAYRKFKK